ncbi:MAG TPA: hypothetical protein VLZ07_10145 [Syntrophales bacterium]|nr:hypothetical protein [Syntrophales bacterium]
MKIREGDCVIIPDGRVARVREVSGHRYKVRVRRQTSNTHQFLYLSADEVELTECPKGWMTPEGYNRYLKVILDKMKKRLATTR